MLKVSLIVVSGKPEGLQVPVAGPVFLIGRDPTCQLKPNAEDVSRKHSEITITEDSVVVKDLGSRNGTFVNGNRLTAPHTLKSGELLKIGQLTFAVLIQEVVTKAATAPARPTPPVETRGKSSDVVEQDKIKTWLVADNTKPTPDRPSGIFDGDTLTMDAYSGGSGTLPAAKPPSSSAQPKPKPASSAEPAAKPGSAPAIPARPLFGEEPGEFERLEEGAGDVAEEAEEEVEGEEDSHDEIFDESNPFYAAKKAQAKGEEAAAKKSYSDTSDAANDILRKLMDRRRASRS